MSPKLEAQERPNIIMVMVDDMGWADTGFNGSAVCKTPNLDMLANAGMKFNRFYAASAVCSPTRASCLTGRNPLRFGVYDANKGRLKEEEISLPELLATEGYVSGHFGKWHLGTLTTQITDANRGRPGNTEEYSIPSSHGYQDYFVTESKVPTYDPMLKPSTYNTGLGESPIYGWAPISNGSNALEYGTKYWVGEENPTTENLDGDDSRMIMDRAIPFMEDAVSDSTPFFAAVWIHTPHLPVVASEDHMALYSNLSHKEQLYYGSITAFDDQMGRLWNKLNELDIADNTILWFCSDNGPENNTPGSAGPYRARKRSLYEGGVRGPAFCVYPDMIRPRSETDFPAVTSDYLPTIIDLLGITYPDERPLDGVSLRGVMNGQTSTREEPIGFIYKEQISWVKQRYKLISQDGGSTYELYDLTFDESEQNNLATQEPGIVNEMKQELEEWLTSVNKSARGDDYGNELSGKTLPFFENFDSIQATIRVDDGSSNFLNSYIAHHAKNSSHWEEEGWCNSYVDTKWRVLSNDASWDNWEPNGGFDIGSVNCIKFVPGINVARDAVVATPLLPLEAGQKYEVSFKLYNWAQAGNSKELKIIWGAHDPVNIPVAGNSAANIATTVGALENVCGVENLTASTNGWQEKTYEFTPEYDAYYRIGLYARSTRAASQHDNAIYIDDILVKKAGEPVDTLNTVDKNIKLYPNPVKDYIFINVENTTNSHYKVINMSAQLIMEGDLIQNQIDLRELKKGFYLLILGEEVLPFVKYK